MSETTETTNNEISNEEIIPTEDLPEANFFEEAYGYNTEYNQSTSKYFPSNIPSKINELHSLHDTIINNPTSQQMEVIGEVMVLKNKMETDILLGNNYNGICVELDTIGFTLKIEENSVLVAL